MATDGGYLYQEKSSQIKEREAPLYKWLVQIVKKKNKMKVKEDRCPSLVAERNLPKKRSEVGVEQKQSC